MADNCGIDVYILIYFLFTVIHIFILFESKNKKLPEGSFFISTIKQIDYLEFLIAACAAARRAIGTRNGEHDT